MKSTVTNTTDLVLPCEDWVSELWYKELSKRRINLKMEARNKSKESWKDEGGDDKGTKRHR